MTLKPIWCRFVRIPLWVTSSGGASLVAKGQRITQSTHHNPNRNHKRDRKRLSIGVEILGLPEIIFLDEPTSGLDSETAFECVRVSTGH